VIQCRVWLESGTAHDCIEVFLILAKQAKKVRYFYPFKAFGHLYAHCTQRMPTGAWG
jgi:hypothetical protein